MPVASRHGGREALEIKKSVKSHAKLHAEGDCRMFISRQNRDYLI